MIYTKTGDLGTTSLIGGTRVSKCNPQVEAYGTVDELGAHVALLAEQLAPLPAFANQHSLLREVQRKLFIIQTLLAIEPDNLHPANVNVDDYTVQLINHCGILEHTIDTLQDSLPQLKSFVIPGGNALSAQCHVARTVCRRAERRIVQLYGLQPYPANNDVLAYINRLSDYLFVLSRHIVVTQGDTECFL